MGDAVPIPTLAVILALKAAFVEMLFVRLFWINCADAEKARKRQQNSVQEAIEAKRILVMIFKIERLKKCVALMVAED
jgi:hypothetical protein